MICGFVGHVEELHRFSEAFDLAEAAIFLTGQPGIGNTRLAREELQLAKERGFSTLQERAYSLGRGLAYAPLVDAFGSLLRRLDPAVL
ncbi:MAG: hypothetical protein HYX94_00820 [Chloroflexi bacterium]|nr:hypothetical protein [Chloroflexota bacterium]